MSQNIIIYFFMLSSRISRIIGENIFRSYTGSTSENTDCMNLEDGQIFSITTEGRQFRIRCEYI